MQGGGRERKKTEMDDWGEKTVMRKAGGMKRGGNKSTRHRGKALQNEDIIRR